jgi:DNA-binding NtrC family response regulator
MKKNILVVADTGHNPGIAEWCFHNEDFQLTIVPTDEEAIELAHQAYFDLVLVDSPTGNRKKLDVVMPILINDIIVTGYYGESAERLQERIKGLFEKRKAERMQRLMILDSSNVKGWNGLPRFSSN